MEAKAERELSRSVTSVGLSEANMRIIGSAGRQRMKRPEGPLPKGRRKAVAKEAEVEEVKARKAKKGERSSRSPGTAQSSGI